MNWCDFNVKVLTDCITDKANLSGGWWQDFLLHSITCSWAKKPHCSLHHHRVKATYLFWKKSWSWTLCEETDPLGIITCSIRKSETVWILNGLPTPELSLGNCTGIHWEYIIHCFKRAVNNKVFWVHCGHRSRVLTNRLGRALETGCSLKLELISHWVNFETI